MTTHSQTFIRKSLETFNRITRPSSKHIQDKHEFELNHSRNKTCIAIAYSALIQFILNLILGHGSAVSNIQGVIACFFISSVQLITTIFEMHPQVFKVVYNIYVFTFAFLLIQNGNHGILGTTLAAPTFPLLVYFLTGSFWHFVVNASLGYAFLNIFGKGIMETNLSYMDSSEISYHITYFINQNIIYILIYVGLIHHTIQKTLYKMRVAEQKKDDFERQKNFLLGFSHELRNLINSVMGNIKLAVLENPSEKIKDFLVSAEVCVELLLHLVHNILDTGKAEINDLEINPTPTKICDTMEKMWNVCSELIKRKNLRGIMKIQKNIPQTLLLDHYRVTQIFLNLVGNSVKYTDVGNINIAVEWIPDKEVVDDKCYRPYPFNDDDDQDEGVFEKNQALSVLDEGFLFLNFVNKKIDQTQLSCSRNGARKGVLKISVSDTGCGILPEDRGKIFQRFTQGTNDASKRMLGTGLGLFITKELCQRMKGDVRAFSKRGVGSTFTFCLPVETVRNERAAAFNRQRTQRIASEQQRLRAMVVDDEQFSQFILKDFLTRINVNVVETAENGLVAHQKFLSRQSNREPIDIVTMDINMPVMNGKDSAKKIRETEAQRNLDPCLLIIISGNISESEIQECMDKDGRIKADVFLKKPVTPEELNRIITLYFDQLNNQA